MSSLRLAVILTILAAAASGPTIAGSQVSQEAKVTIAKVQRAAQERDFRTLRTLMAKEFEWSFGANGVDADEAIKEWRNDKASMRALVDVLKRGCHAKSPKSVYCPGKGGYAYRALFEKGKNGWRMTVFVNGD